VRTARAKGLSERTAVVRHALRSALIPITTIVGMRFGHLLGGAVIVETVFAWPGIGKSGDQSGGDRLQPPG
jgi:peptide/nickel transport system permease protein